MSHAASMTDEKDEMVVDSLQILKQKNKTKNYT